MISPANIDLGVLKKDEVEWIGEEPDTAMEWMIHSQSNFLLDWKDIVRRHRCHDVREIDTWYGDFMHKVYLRYEGLMKLCGQTPTPKDSFWPRRSMDGVAFLSSTIHTSPAAFFEDERPPPPEFWEVYRVLAMCADTNYPAETVVVREPKQLTKPSHKRNRGAGTDWIPAPSDQKDAELDTLYRSLDMKCLKERLSTKDVDILRTYIKDVTVDVRRRGENDTKKPKTDDNKKRNAKPLYRYGHPLITEELLDTVLLMQGNKKNEYVTYAPSRAACMWCFLHAIGIESSYWPAGQNFPRPAIR